MLACYCLEGKQLASGVIGLLTCQSHYNVSGINRTPCARLLLRHTLAQRIPTEACEFSVSVEVVNTYKYLGVHMDNKLDWSANIDAIYKKGQSRLYFRRRLRSFNACACFTSRWLPASSFMLWCAGEAA